MKAHLVVHAHGILCLVAHGLLWENERVSLQLAVISETYRVLVGVSAHRVSSLLSVRLLALERESENSTIRETIHTDFGLHARRDGIISTLHGVA